MLKIEVHSFRKGSPFDLTPWVRSVVWNESLTPPWETIEVQLTIPFGIQVDATKRDAIDNRNSAGGSIQAYYVESVAGGRIAIGVDDWITVSDTSGLLAFGKIDTRSRGLHGEPGGKVVSDPTLISTVGWLDYLCASTVQVAAGLEADLGTLFSGLERSVYFNFLSLVGNGISAESISPMLKLLGHMHYPASIFGGDGFGRVGDLPIVIFADDGNRRIHAPNRVTDEIRGINMSGFRFNTPSGTILDMVLGLFQPEPRMIEFFPSLEAPANPTGSGERKAYPVVVHRMRPWRTRSVRDMEQISAGGSRPSIRTDAFDKPTWDVSRALMLGGGDVHSLQPIQGEAERCNVVSFIWSAVGLSEPFMLEGAGAPVYDASNVARFGARPVNLRWDFLQFNSSDSVDARKRQAAEIGRQAKVGELNESDMLDFMRGYMYQGWQFYGHAHAFESGTINARYLGRSARPGEIVRVALGARRPYTAYMERITHKVVMRQGGSMQASTGIQFSRGLDDERKRDPHIYVSSASPPPKPTQDVAQPNKTAEAVQTILVNGVERPWRGKSQIKRMLLDQSRLDGREVRKPSQVDMLVAHYSDGSPANEDGVATRNYFNKPNKDNPQGGTQFIIAVDGTILQIMDAALSAGHAGENDSKTTVTTSGGLTLPQSEIFVKATIPRDSTGKKLGPGFLDSGEFLIETVSSGPQVITYTSRTETSLVGCQGGKGVIKPDGDVVFLSQGGHANRRSIGVEIVVPIGLPFDKSRGLPWPGFTGWCIGLLDSMRSKTYYGPTDAQKRAFRELAQWCNAGIATSGDYASESGVSGWGFHVPLVSPQAQPLADKRIMPLWSKASKVKTLSAGLWHHCELARDRIDCLGMSMHEILGTS